MFGRRRVFLGGVLTFASIDIGWRLALLANVPVAAAAFVLV